MCIYILRGLTTNKISGMNYKFRYFGIESWHQSPSGPSDLGVNPLKLLNVHLREISCRGLVYPRISACSKIGHSLDT